MLKYPRYTRKENRAIKYSEEQIQEIKDLKKEGLSNKKISLRTGIPESTIWYNLLPQEEKDTFNKMKYKNSPGKKLSKEKMKEYNDDRKKRKKGFREYELALKKKEKDDPEKRQRKKEYNRIYREKNKESLLEKCRKYYNDHKDDPEYKKKVREYGKKYRARQKKKKEK